MYQLTLQEVMDSRSQFVTLKRGQNIKYLPYAFSEQGVAMLSSVLNSERAIRVNIQIMRAFVRLRYILSSHKAIEWKLRELEKRLEGHDTDIRDIFEAIRLLMGLPAEGAVVKGFAHSK